MIEARIAIAYSIDRIIETLHLEARKIASEFATINLDFEYNEFDVFRRTVINMQWHNEQAKQLWEIYIEQVRQLEDKRDSLTAKP